jgi:hypothetical protein
MTPDPEVLNRVALWRQMEKDGTMSDDELITAVIWLREKRRAAGRDLRGSSRRGQAQKVQSACQRGRPSRRTWTLTRSEDVG